MLSCSADNPVEPYTQTNPVPPQTAAAQNAGQLRHHSEPLSVGDLLSDPLFQALVDGIETPDLADPLQAAVDALGSGQLARAKHLIAEASAAADALGDEPGVSPDLITWSAIERYFDAAELT